MEEIDSSAVSVRDASRAEDSILADRSEKNYVYFASKDLLNSKADLASTTEQKIQSNWLENNLLNPVYNALIADTWNAAKNVINFLPEKLGLEAPLTKLELREQSSEGLSSSSFWIQAVSGGLAMAIPYALAGKFAGGITRSIGREYGNGLGNFVEHNLGNRFSNLASGVKTAGNWSMGERGSSIIGAAAYDFVRDTKEHETHLGNMLGGAAGFTVFEYGNKFVRQALPLHRPNGVQVMHGAGGLQGLSELGHNGLINNAVQSQVSNLLKRGLAQLSVGAVGGTAQLATSSSIAYMQTGESHLNSEQFMSHGITSAAMNVLLPGAQKVIGRGIDMANQKLARGIPAERYTDYYTADKRDPAIIEHANNNREYRIFSVKDKDAHYIDHESKSVHLFGIQNSSPYSSRLFGFASIKLGDNAKLGHELAHATFNKEKPANSNVNLEGLNAEVRYKQYENMRVESEQFARQIEKGILARSNRIAEATTISTRKEDILNQQTGVEGAYGARTFRDHFKQEYDLSPNSPRIFKDYLGRKLSDSEQQTVRDVIAINPGWQKRMEEMWQYQPEQFNHALSSWKIEPSFPIDVAVEVGGGVLFHQNVAKMAWLEVRKDASNFDSNGNLSYAGDRKLQAVYDQIRSGGPDSVAVYARSPLEAIRIIRPELNAENVLLLSHLFAKNPKQVKDKIAEFKDYPIRSLEDSLAAFDPYGHFRNGQLRNGPFKDRLDILFQSGDDSKILETLAKAISTYDGHSKQLALKARSHLAWLETQGLTNLSNQDRVVLANALSYHENLRQGIVEAYRTEPQVLQHAINGWKIDPSFTPSIAIEVGQLKQTWQKYASRLAWTEVRQDPNNFDRSGNLSDHGLAKYNEHKDALLKSGKVEVAKQANDSLEIVRILYPNLKEADKFLLAHSLDGLNVSVAERVAKIEKLNFGAYQNALAHLDADSRLRNKIAEQLSREPNMSMAQVRKLITNNDWQADSALRLVSVFDQRWQEWLTNAQKHNLSAKDVSHWLPVENNAETKNLAEWLLSNQARLSLPVAIRKHRLTEDGLNQMDPANRPIVEVVDLPSGLDAVKSVASRWGELQLDKYRNRYDFESMVKIARFYKYENVKNHEFALESANWLVEPKDYYIYEKRFIVSQSTPSPFPLEKRFESGDLVGYFIPRSDPRGLYLGHYTGSCQYPGHRNGHEPAWHGQESVDGGFFIVTRKNNPNDIVAESWTLVSREGGLIFDSIESTGYRAFTAGNAGDLAHIYKSAAKDLGQSKFPFVTLGVNIDHVQARYPRMKEMMDEFYATWKELRKEDSLNMPIHYGYKYSDAMKGKQLLLFENLRETGPLKKTQDESTYLRLATSEDAAFIKEQDAKHGSPLLPGELPLILESNIFGPIAHLMVDRTQKSVQVSSPEKLKFIDRKHFEPIIRLLAQHGQVWHLDNAPAYGKYRIFADHAERANPLFTIPTKPVQLGTRDLILFQADLANLRQYSPAIKKLDAEGILKQPFIFAPIPGISREQTMVQEPIFRLLIQPIKSK